jgi:amidase
VLRIASLRPTLGRVPHAATVGLVDMPISGQLLEVEGPLARQSLLRARGEFAQEHPLIVAPIFTGVPFEAGSGYTTAEVTEIVHGLRMTIAVNALRLPAVALPIGVGDGLPQAVQVIGPRYREDMCLDAAAALEERAGIITPIDPRW